MRFTRRPPLTSVISILPERDSADNVPLSTVLICKSPVPRFTIAPTSAVRLISLPRNTATSVSMRKSSPANSTTSPLPVLVRLSKIKLPSSEVMKTPPLAEAVMVALSGCTKCKALAAVPIEPELSIVILPTLRRLPAFGAVISPPVAMIRVSEPEFSMLPFKIMPAFEVISREPVSEPIKRIATSLSAINDWS